MTPSPAHARHGEAAASLRHNAAWALAGNVGYAACQFGVLAAIAKLTTAADVGRFALALALAAPVIGLSNLNLRALQATDARGDYVFGAYLGLRLVTTTIALVVVWGIALGFGYRGATLALILLVAIAKAFESLSDVVYGRLQKAENLRRIAISMLTKGVLSVLAVAVVLRFTGDLLMSTLALALCWIGVFLAYDLPAATRLESARPQLHGPTLRRLGWLALPLGFVTGIASLAVNIPRYDIEAYLGSTALGHFAAIAYVAVALSQPALALGTAISPRLARYFISDRRAYRSLSIRAILTASILGCLVVAGAALFGERFLRLAYTPEYATHYDLLVWVAVSTGAAFVSVALGYAVTAARRLREQVWMAVASVVVCAVTSHFAVPRFGLIGASWALLAGEMARVLCLGAIYISLLSSSSPATGTVGIGALNGEPSACRS